MTVVPVAGPHVIGETNRKEFHIVTVPYMGPMLEVLGQQLRDPEDLGIGPEMRIGPG